MTVKEDLDRVLALLSNERLTELLDYARYLHWQDEQQAWQEFGQTQLARAYGPDEPEYGAGSGVQISELRRMDVGQHRDPQPPQF